MCSGEEQEPIRIACIGSSVTKGTGLCDPSTQSYPAQLAAFLSAQGYPAANVRNFGEGGAGILKRGCNPYCDTEQYGEALAFDAHIVIILLGTNDCRESFWGNDEANALLHAQEDMCYDFAKEEKRKAIVYGELEFERDLQELVEVFGMMPAEALVVLCTPAPLFDASGWLKQTLLRDEIAPRIRRVAGMQGLRLVELYDSSLVQCPEIFPDGLHPNAAGAREIAALVGQALLADLDGSGDDQQEEGSRTDQAVPTDEQRVEEERQIVLQELSKMRQQ